MQGRKTGGRKAGTPNKATVERQEKLAEAKDRVLQAITPEQIAGMAPLDVMLFAMHLEAQTGEWRAAAMLAKEAAPYLHAKKLSEGESEREDTLTIKGGLPD